MRLIILHGIVSALVAGAVAPVQAQRSPASGGYDPVVPREAAVGPGWGRDLGDVRERIEDGRDSGQLSRREARQLRRGANGIADMADRYAAGGLSDAERRELDTRTTVLRDQANARRLGVGTPRTR